MDSKTEAITKAVAWWSNFLKHTETSRFNNGDHSFQGIMTAGLADICKPKTHPPAEIEAFENRLTEILTEETPRYTGVDYDPEGALGVAASETLSKVWQVFPCKTQMWLDYTTGKVTVSEGYRAPVKEI